MTAPHGTEPGAAETAADDPQDARPTTAAQGTRPDPGPPPARTDPGAGWAPGGAPDRTEAMSRPDPQRTTVLPGGGAAARPPARPVPPRPGPARPAARAAGPATRPVSARSRRARLALRRIDPWSVFLFSLVAAVFLGVAFVVATAVLYSVLGSLGVTDSLNQLYAEVTGADATTTPLLTTGRIVGGAAVLAAVNVVLLTLLATLGSLLYNLCASFTGGLELTLGERD